MVYHASPAYAPGGFAASSPLLGVDIPSRPLCGGTNLATSSRIAALKPDVVVLVASWRPTIYEHRPHTRSPGRNAYGRVVVVARFRSGGIPSPRTLFSYARRDHRRGVPRRLASELPDSVLEVETQLRRQVLEAGAIYVSPLDVLCDHGGWRWRESIPARSSRVMKITSATGSAYVMSGCRARPCWGRCRAAVLTSPAV